MKTKQKLTYLFILFVTIVCGCKKDQPLNENLKEINSKRMSNGNSTFSAGDGKYDILAYGFDATGDFYDENSISDAPIIDIAKFAAVYPQRINIGTGSSGNDSVVVGSNVIDFLKETNKRDATNLEVSYGQKEATNDSSYFFSANGNFEKQSDSKYTYYSKFTYANFESTRYVKRVRFTGDATKELLLNYLTSEFTANIANQSAETLVLRYGTHILLDVNLGGRLRFDFNAALERESDYTRKKRGIKLGLAGRLKAFGLNLSHDSSNEEITKTLTESMDQHLTLSYVGGTNSGMSFVIPADNSGSQSFNLASWQQSVNESNCRLIKIGKAVRLSEFIKDPVKKAQVNAAIEKHIKDSQIAELGELPVYEYYSRSLNVWRYEFNPSQLAYLHDGSWEFKGIPFYAFKTRVPGSVPINEFYAPTTHDCVWSQQNLTSSYWKNGGVKFYAYPNAMPKSKAIYSYYHHKSRRSHFLGSSPGKPGPQDEWTNEGIAFYVP